MRRREAKQGVKDPGLTRELRFELVFLSIGWVSRIPGVGVKSIDIGRNTGREGGSLACN